MNDWQDPSNFLLIIIFILIVIVLLVVTTVSVIYISYHRLLRSKEAQHRKTLEHEKKLLNVSLEAQEKERERIAADLHDNIISKLTIIRLKSAMGTDSKELDHLLGNTIDESRRISHDLAPPLYENKTLVDVIRSVLESWESIYIVKFYIVADDDLMVDKNTKLQIVRILQELLNNIHKHAKASEIKMIIRIKKNQISFVLQNDGVGFSKNKGKGIGLQNIDLRTNQLNAKYKFRTKQDKGTRFIFDMSYGKISHSNSR